MLRWCGFFSYCALTPEQNARQLTVDRIHGRSSNGAGENAAYQGDDERRMGGAVFYRAVAESGDQREVYDWEWYVSEEELLVNVVARLKPIANDWQQKAKRREHNQDWVAANKQDPISCWWMIS